MINAAVPPQASLASKKQRSDVVVHLCACANGLEAAADRLPDATVKVSRGRGKLLAVATKLPITVDPRPVLTGGQSQAGQPGINESEAARLKVVEDRLRQLQADSDRLDAVAIRLKAVADRLGANSLKPLVDAELPLRSAAQSFRDAARRIGYEAFALPAHAADVIEAAADEVKATVSRLPSASGFRACASQLSEAARLLPGDDAHTFLLNAANELSRVIGEYPSPSGQQPPVAGEWDAAVLQLRSLAYELQNEAQNVKNVRQSLTEADADVEELRLIEQTVRNFRGDVLFHLCGGYPPIAFTQISNLLGIGNDARLQKAQEVWLRQEKDLSRKVMRREAASADVRTQIYNIIGWYAVYLGVVLTAVTQLTQTSSTSNGKRPLCWKVWFPVLLTVVGLIVIVIALRLKFISLNSLENTIHSDRKISAELQQRILRIEQKGLDFDFVKDVDNESRKDEAKNHWGPFILVALALLVFAGIFSVSYAAVLCW